MTELYRVMWGKVYVQRDGQSKASLQAQACLDRGGECFKLLETLARAKRA